MANTYKNIVITPNRDTDAANVPVIRFSGGDATLNTDINLRVYTTQSGTLSFEGSAGQLFSITNDLTNSIFSVNDVSGIPSIDVYANGDILLAPFGGQIVVGNTTNLNFDSTRSTKIVDPVANTLAFHTAQTERVRIDSSGRVGIGTTSLDELFQVAGPVVSSSATLANKTSAASFDFGGGFNSGRILAWGSVGSVANITFWSGSGGGGATERMRIDPTGNLLIGRTNSTVGQGIKLDVNGGINASAVLVNGAAIESGISTGKAIAMALVFGG